MTDTSPATPPAPTAEEIAALNKRVKIGRLLTLHCYGALLLLYTVLNILADTQQLNWWLIQCVPLLIFIPGLRSNHYKTYSWLCFVTLIYFTALVPEVMSPVSEWSHWLQLALISTLFCAAMMTSRWRQRQMIQQQELTY